MNILTKIVEFMVMFKPGFSTVYSIWGTIVSVLLFYKTIYIVVGAVCTRKFEPAKKKHKYGIVIAARNEQEVIGNLLDSIQKQDYDMSFVTTFVVADNCTDGGETARIARDGGAIVYERFDKEHATKGYALQYLFENIERDYGTQNFEGFFVFDADNLLKSDFISRMNDAFDSGEKIITSYRNSKNFDQNWISSNYALHWLRSARQAHRARSVFRLATNIQGTGFLFASEIVKNGWKYTSLTEDRALTADAVVQGYQITYNDAAEFYDEQPTSLKIALRQRIRWAKGHIMAFSESGWGLFKNIFTYKGKSFRDTVRQRFACFDMFILVLPRPLVSLAKQILKAVVFLTAYAAFPNFWILTANYFASILAYRIKNYVNNMLSAIYVFVFEGKRIKKISLWDKVKYTITWPIFDIIGKYSMYIALFKKVTWKPIPHTSKVSIDDVSKPREVYVPAFLQKAGKNARLRFNAHIAFLALSFAYSFFMLSYKPSIFFVFAGVNFLLTGLHLMCDLNKKTPRFFNIALMFLTFIWNITLCSEVMGNGAITYIFSFRLVLNLLLYALPYMIFYTVTNSVKISTIVTSLFWLIMSSANFFLTSVRGRPLFLSDFFSLGTAMSVANEYKFDITVFYIATLIYVTAMIAYFFLLEKAHEKGFFKIKWYIRYPSNAAVAACLALLMTSSSALSFFGVTPYFWSHKVNGFPLNFVMDMQYSRVNAPSGYSPDDINALYEQYAAGSIDINAYDKSQRPNVIAIMNESYSDLRVIGDFDTNIDVTPFIDSLCEDPSVISGYSYVSVFGGGTADSEYEFLTGDNMFMYPQGAVPYQTNFKGVSFFPSLVSTFNALGYRTIATHPYYASGWNRPTVYSSMGFDEQRFIDDYKKPSYLRAYINDKSDFDDLINLYESKEANEPLFIFNITMQNHGGYTTSYSNFNQKVELRNTAKKYPVAEQYLSLLHETDSAVARLISYFDTVDEPTVIVFFGDHQVQLEDDFYAELYGKPTGELTEEDLLKKYITRFFIWSNFDMNTPQGYAYLAQLEQDMRPMVNTPNDITESGDVSASDAALHTEKQTAAQTDLADLTVAPVSKDRYKDISGLYSDNEADAAASDAAASDAENSDAVTSDAEISDSIQHKETAEEHYVVQSRVQSPQIITNLSYLSGIMCEAAGLPASAYQIYLQNLQEEYPVITVFGSIDKKGEYHLTDDALKSEIGLYACAIYNHIYDKTNRVTALFAITPDMVAIHNDVLCLFKAAPDNWIEDGKSMNAWLRKVKQQVKGFENDE